MITLPQRISEKRNAMPPRIGLNSCLRGSKSGGEGYSEFKDGIVKRTTHGVFQNSYRQVKKTETADNLLLLVEKYKMTSLCTNSTFGFCRHAKPTRKNQKSLFCCQRSTELIEL